MAMDEKQAGQVATAGLVFGLLGFVMVIVLGVYVLFYDSSNDTTPSSVPKMPMRAYQAAAAYPQYRARMAMPGAPMPPMPPLAEPPYQPLPAQTYAAPPIPPTVPSGVVGSFFDDELPQA